MSVNINELFCDYFDKWINDFKVDSVRKITLQKYKYALQSLRKIAPDLKICDLDRQEYQNIINVYAETHEKQTTKDFHRYIKPCIMDLMEENLILKDPTKKVVIKGREPIYEKKIKFLSQFEVQCLIRTLDLGNKINMDYLILLLLKTGLRFAEAIGLTPQDFDFSNQTITVNKTWNYKNVGEKIGFAPTKNKSSVRTIQVDWKTLQKFQPLIKDIPLNEPIFLYGKTVKNLYPSVLNDALKKRCKEAQIPVVSPHGLRHTHASLLLANGVSIASVSKRLGHSNMATTQNVYLHIIKELENKDNGLALAAMMNLGE